MGFAKRSAGILVFPNIVKAGFGFGGEYGEGSLMIRGHPAEYYNTVSASFGFQLGAQARSVIIMFMTPDALEGFRRKDGWKVWRLGPDGEPVEPWPAFRIPDDVIWMERFSILL
jgi:lipid-binding SYLF domain-containing protein